MLRSASRSFLSRPSLRLQSLKASVGARIQRSSFATGADDVFLSTVNANYIDEMYHAWKNDPASVHVSWQSYFKNLESGTASSKSFVAPPSIVPGSIPSGVVPGAGSSGIADHMKIQLLVRAYQVRGHARAKTDPLEISFGHSKQPPAKELTYQYYGFTEADLDNEYALGPGILPGFAGDKNTRTLREIIEICEKTYCGSYGVEYMHIPSREQCDWIRERIEVPQPYKFPTDEKRRILDRLIWAVSFEAFLSTKFPNDKRFGLEGGESTIPAMKILIDESVEHGVEDVVIGMPHRGRLNMLSNVVRKPNESIFKEFTASASFDTGSGDVKYHLGSNYQRPTPSGKKVNLSLVANPSHLEAEDPVVLGKTRAIQFYKNDEEVGEKAMAVLLHGDAAFAGQGVVYETFGFANLPGYSTGGTVHIIINNQIGFTTDPRFSRSTPYPSDLAKAVDAPIFHVNADDAEAMYFIFKLAADWRAKFKSDVVIDVVCYRKHGHNETDQPSFTQPLMYKKIQQKQNVFDIYTKKLVEEGTFTKEDVEEHKKWVWNLMEEAFSRSKDYVPNQKEWLASAWDGFKTCKELATEILPHLPTAVERPVLSKIGEVISTPPEGFQVHRNLKRILNNRLKTVEEGKNIDWSTGEALAFGSLLKEGYHVRLSGEDVERGTFSQRHAVLHDQETEKTYTPLQHAFPDQAAFHVVNSSLSEYGVMGFEYGYTLTNPDALVIWEAQFGDFANTGQVIIDLFIAAGEQKWAQRSGLVLSLPHGFDGQGPDHSSSRLERFLALCNEDPRHFPSVEALKRQHQDCNMQVVYPTTPANLFHILRRQMHRQFRKPLVLLFSKSLLRHPLARSSIEDFTGDSSFQWIIEDPAELPKEEVKRVVFCSGQVFTALSKYRETNNVKDTAFVRVEQMHPFPYAQIRDLLNTYPNLADITWCQEEPLNMGAYAYIVQRFNTTFKETEKYKDATLRYSGRDPNPGVAAGSKTLHHDEEEAFLKSAFQA